MTWSLENSKSDEASKIRWELVPYMHGHCLDIGCGLYKVFPHFTGVDSGHQWGMRGVDIRSDAANLSRFADESHDLVFSSHLLEHIGDYRAALKEWWRVIKVGGHLALYLPHKAFYPNIGQPGSNPDHKHDFVPDDIVTAMKELGGWDLLQNEERNGRDEYSFFQVYRKRADGEQTYPQPRPAKTAAVVRYGAQGDMAQMSSILPWLKEQGYHVTVYCQDGLGHEVIKHDPHVDRFIVQGKDEVPNAFLGEFFEEIGKKYDKFVNLCESVESTLLASPGRAAWFWPNEVRAKHMDRNYLEWTHALAQVPPPYRPKFYSTPKEREKAQWTARKWGRKNVLWSLAGSSGHKVWPHLDAIIARIMLAYPDVHVVLVGDESCKLLEQGWGKEPRVHCRSGEWSIRESMAFAEVADLIIGTETGLLNAAGFMDTPKIITLSHSSHEMLTKHWVNALVLQQPQGVGCPKSPCRQLHGAEASDCWLDCPRHEETGTALCQYSISPEAMWVAIQTVLGTVEELPQRVRRAA